MMYRTLRSTGMKVSVVGLATWQLCGEWGKAFSPDEVRDIFDEGVAMLKNVLMAETGKMFWA